MLIDGLKGVWKVGEKSARGGFIVHLLKKGTLNKAACGSKVILNGFSGWVETEPCKCCLKMSQEK